MSGAHSAFPENLQTKPPPSVKMIPMEHHSVQRPANGHQRFVNFLENLQNIAIQGYRIDGTVTYWNKDSERLYGFTESEAMGRNLVDLIIPEEMRGEVLIAIKNMAESDQAIPAAELLLKKKDGSRVPVFSNHVLVQLPGEEAELFCIDIDLSEQKKAEAEREQLTAQLRQLHKAESLNRMAAAIAHHFNNQLTAVIGNLEMIVDDLPGEAAATRALAQEAMRAANRAADIGTLLLTYLGQTVSHKVLFDLTALCRRNLGILQSFLLGNITVSGTFSEKETMINGNPEQIQQLLANLFINAREAIGKEAGTIRIGVAVGAVPDSSRWLRMPVDWRPAGPESVYAVLTVADDGCGIGEGELEKIFDPFYSSKFVGRGMGLSTVLGIAKLHGGAVAVNSRVGEGSTFQVFLPLTEPSSTLATE